MEPTEARASATVAAPISDAVIADLADAFEAELAFYNTPGGAFALVQHGQVVHVQGFGQRNLATGEPFTPQTQFRTGSTGKSLTALMVAQMVDQGVLAWDTPVRNILPAFQTRDPVLTARLTVRDLMGMSTGLVSTEAWSGSTTDALLAEIARQEIAGPYHQYYSYNSELFAAAAYVALAAAGEPPSPGAYAERMNSAVFAPIGMPSAILTDDPDLLSANYTLSYDCPLAPSLCDPAQRRDPVDLVELGMLATAGGFWMNLDDMARYLLTQMNGGVTPDGVRIVSADNLAETWAPGVAVAANPPAPEMYHYLPYQDAHYGMGWITTTYRGIPIRHHGGGIDAYRTVIAVLPEMDAGLIIFTNGGGYGPIDGGLLLHFAELVYGLEPQALAETHRLYETELRTYLAGVLGRYEAGWGVTLHEGRLWLMNEAGEQQLFVESVSPNEGLVAKPKELGGEVLFHAVDGRTALTFADGTTVARVSD
jgi:CubicO group peptidase (beta-lactamase class C family)